MHANSSDMPASTVLVQAANNSPVVGHGSPRKHKQAGFISRLCGHGKESEDAHVPGKKWVQVFDHTGAKLVPRLFSKAL